VHDPVRVTTADFSVFFAWLSLACWAATLAVIVLILAARFGRNERVDLLLDDIARVGLWLAWLVAVVTTLGSLYFSEIAHFTPCKLCWYQRIAIYPLSLTLLVAALRRDRRVGWYVIPVATVGAALAAYHTQLQAFPRQHSGFCTTTEPCTVRYVWEFGFVSLPFMALSAFVFVITITMLVGRRCPTSTTEAGRT
jgi:Disulfide bond formation protein DsbB